MEVVRSLLWLGRGCNNSKTNPRIVQSPSNGISNPIVVIVIVSYSYSTSNSDNALPGTVHAAKMVCHMLARPPHKTQPELRLRLSA